MGIEDLSQGTATSASQIPFHDTPNGQDRRTSLADLAAVIAGLNESSSVAMTTQYAAPSATGFSVTIAPLTDGGSVFLALTPNAGYAAGTIVMPAVAECVDGQELLVHCTQAVTALTMSGNGATFSGAPTTLTAASFFRLRFDAVLSRWYRVG